MGMKSIPILLFALAGATFISCTRKDSDSGTEEDQTWAILAKDDLSDDDSDLFQQIWEPSQSDVPRAIQATRLYLENLKKTTSSDSQREKITEILGGWDRYLCQAIGHVKDGKKLIHLNFFAKEDVSEEDFTTWQHHYIAGSNGGTEYWRIEYDYKAQTFSDFEINDDD